MSQHISPHTLPVPIGRSPRPPRSRNRRKPSPRLMVEMLESRAVPTQAGASSILLLDPSGRDSLSATGNGLIAVTGDGSITVDSSNAEAALAAGHGRISAGALFVRGGAKSTGPGSLP